jgi:hypothetical protein
LTFRCCLCYWLSVTIYNWIFYFHFLFNAPESIITYFRPLRFCAPKDFKIIWLSTILAFSIHDEGNSRNASCALNVFIIAYLNDRFFLSILLFLLVWKGFFYFYLPISYLIDWLIDWSLTPTLAIFHFQLYRGMNRFN